MKINIKNIKHTNKLKGGKGDNKNLSDFDLSQVKKGISHELEHTKDLEIAAEITSDHLSELPNYYDKLDKVEKTDESIMNEELDTSFIQDISVMIDKQGHSNTLVLINSARLKAALKDFHSFTYKTLIEKNILIGSITFSKTGNEKIPCYDSFVIDTISVNPVYKGKGLGQLLFGLNMAAIYPEYLTPDRYSVSQDFVKAFSAFVKSNDLKTNPPKGDKTLGHFDNYQEPITAVKIDDCPVYNNPLLDKAYSTNKYSSILKHLMLNYEKNFQHLKIDNDIVKAATITFINAYEPKNLETSNYDDKELRSEMNESFKKLNKPLTLYWNDRAKKRAKRAGRNYPNNIDRDWAYSQQSKSSSVDSTLSKLFNQEEEKINEAEKKWGILKKNYRGSNRTPDNKIPHPSFTVAGGVFSESLVLLKEQPHIIFNNDALLIDPYLEKNPEIGDIYWKYKKDIVMPVEINNEPYFVWFSTNDEAKVAKNITDLPVHNVFYYNHPSPKPLVVLLEKSKDK